MIQKPSLKPMRATPNGTSRIFVAIRADIYADGVKEMLSEFGEHFGFEQQTFHLKINPLYDPSEIIAYINSFNDDDCKEKFGEPDTSPHPEGESQKRTRNIGPRRSVAAHRQAAAPGLALGLLRNSST